MSKDLTCYEGVKLFHKTSGITFPDKPVTPSKDEIRLGLSLITEELVELFRDGFGLDGLLLMELEEILEKSVTDVAGIIDYNPKQAVDALADINFVVNRLGGVLGLDMDKVDEVVFRSNMSKFSKSLDEAADTVKFYQRQGRDVYTTKVGEYYVIKDVNTNKVLKCQATFKEPDFTEVLE